MAEESTNVTNTSTERSIELHERCQRVNKVYQEYLARIRRVFHIPSPTSRFIDVLTIFSEQPNIYTQNSASLHKMMAVGLRLFSCSISVTSFLRYSLSLSSADRSELMITVFRLSICSSNFALSRIRCASVEFVSTTFSQHYSISSTLSRLRPIQLS